MTGSDRPLRARAAALARDVADVLRGATFGRHLNRYSSPGERPGDAGGSPRADREAADRREE